MQNLRLWNVRCLMASHFHKTSFQVSIEVTNLSQMNWGVFITGLGQKVLQNNQSLRNFCSWGFRMLAN